MSDWQHRADLYNELAAMWEDHARGYQQQAAEMWAKADEARNKATDLMLDQPDDLDTYEFHTKP